LRAATIVGEAVSIATLMRRASADLQSRSEVSSRAMVRAGGTVTVYPGATDTPMMRSSKAGPELGFAREPASAVAEAILAGIEADAFEVIRGAEVRAAMIALNRDDPAALDERLLDMKPALAAAVRDHSAL